MNAAAARWPHSGARSAVKATRARFVARAVRPMAAAAASIPPSPFSDPRFLVNAKHFRAHGKHVRVVMAVLPGGTTKYAGSFIHADATEANRAASAFIARNGDAAYASALRATKAEAMEAAHPLARATATARGFDVLELTEDTVVDRWTFETVVLMKGTRVYGKVDAHLAFANPTCVWCFPITSVPTDDPSHGNYIDFLWIPVAALARVRA